MDSKTQQRLTRSLMRRGSVDVNFDDEFIATEEPKTPLRRSTRKSKVSQSETKFKRTARKRRQSVCEGLNNCVVELLTEPAVTSRQMQVRNKLQQKCFVNIESLTPGKLDLVKVVSSPLVEIRNKLASQRCKNYESAKGASINTSKTTHNVNDEKCSHVEGIMVKDEVVSTEIDVKQETKEDLTTVGKNTMNDTFTVLSDEGNLSNSEPIEDSSFTKNEDAFSVSPLPPFNSDSTNEFVVNRNINERSRQEQRRLSISEKLSKSIKRAKPQKLTNTSKIMRNSTVGLSRTPKISGSKAIQLYEFLTDKQFGTNSPNNLSQTNNSTDVFDTPPSNSSTPKILKNHVINSLLKSTLKKNTVTFGNTTNINSDSSSEDTVRKVSRGKMPNFALIHKKQFDKMENISDYQCRKNQRAKILLSGNKSLPDMSGKVTPTNKAIKRELMISFNRMPRKIEEMKYEEERKQIIAHRPILNDSRPKILPAECLKSAMRKEKLSAEDQVAQQDGKMKAKKVTMNISPDKVLGCDRPGFPVRKTPFKETSNVERCFLNQKKINLQLDFEEESKPSTNKNELCSSQTGMQRDNNIALVKDGALIKNQSSKDRKTTGKAKVWMPASIASSKSKSGYIPSKEKTGYTRFGFSVPVKKKKEDIVKAVVNKTRLPADNQATDEKRAIIKGVRSNRRFDLLMKMRLNK